VELAHRTGQTVSFNVTPVLGRGWPGEAFPGDIAEVIVYNRTLTDVERETVSAYLTAKYAPPSITVPPVPTLSAAVASLTSVSLSWTAPPSGLHTVTSSSANRRAVRLPR